MRLALIACILASAGLLSGPADARSRERDKDQQEQSQQKQEKQEKKQERKEQWRDQRREARARDADAARRAQQRNGGGRVLSVEPEGAGHRVKVLKDGEVRILHVEDE